jgi:hypothetical protein
MAALDAQVVPALLRRLEGDMDRSVEHQMMFALMRANPAAALVDALRHSRKPALQRRALAILDQVPGTPLTAVDVLPLLDSHDSALAAAAGGVASKHRDWMPDITGHFSSKLKGTGLSPGWLSLLETAVKPWLAEPSVRELASPNLARQDWTRR